MGTINQSLIRRGGPIWRSKGLISSTRVNTSANLNATQIPIPAGTRLLRLAPLESVDYRVWITEAGIAQPLVKATPPDGGLTVNGSAQEGLDIWLEADDFPEVWFAETGGADLTVHVSFYE